MILAAGLSPAWQQTVVLDGLHVGEVNRAREVLWCASGKVLNVGLAAHTLVSPAKGNLLTLALVGGTTGEAIRHNFSELGVPARWVHSHSPTRVCTTILDRETGRTTELVENAAAIDAADLARFRDAFREESRSARVLVLSGSFPEGTPISLYRDLLELSACPVIVDCQGQPLLSALEARPFVVKPNREELGRTIGQPVETEADLHAAMRRLNQEGATWVVVTEGRKRVWISSADRMLSIDPPEMEANNPIGSGDSLAAGIAVGLADGYDLPDAVALGVAAAAANVRSLLPARFALEDVQTLRPKIHLEDHTVHR